MGALVCIGYLVLGTMMNIAGNDFWIHLRYVPDTECHTLREKVENIDHDE